MVKALSILFLFLFIISSNSFGQLDTSLLGVKKVSHQFGLQFGGGINKLMYEESVSCIDCGVLSFKSKPFFYIGGFYVRQRSNFYQGLELGFGTIGNEMVIDYSVTKPDIKVTSFSNYINIIPSLGLQVNKFFLELNSGLNIFMNRFEKYNENDVVNSFTPISSYWFQPKIIVLQSGLSFAYSLTEFWKIGYSSTYYYSFRGWSNGLYLKLQLK